MGQRWAGLASCLWDILPSFLPLPPTHRRTLSSASGHPLWGPPGGRLAALPEEPVPCPQPLLPGLDPPLPELGLNLPGACLSALDHDCGLHLGEQIEDRTTLATYLHLSVFIVTSHRTNTPPPAPCRLALFSPSQEVHPFFTGSLTHILAQACWKPPTV